MQEAIFFSISLDEASMHGRFNLCIHAYVMEDERSRREEDHLNLCTRMFWQNWWTVHTSSMTRP